MRRRRRREKRASPQVLEQSVEVQFACLLGLISGKEERSWQDFKTWVRKKVVVLIREERKSLKLKCIGETVSASMSKEDQTMPKNGTHVLLWDDKSSELGTPCSSKERCKNQQKKVVSCRALASKSNNAQNAVCSTTIE
jgi:hypothetical protein